MDSNELRKACEMAGLNWEADDADYPDYVSDSMGNTWDCTDPALPAYVAELLRMSKPSDKDALILADAHLQNLESLLEKKDKQLDEMVSIVYDLESRIADLESEIEWCQQNWS